jgi:hypothetical protein
MESVSEYRCRRCGNILPGDRPPGDLCQECRSSSPSEAVPPPEMATQTLAASSSSELPGRIGPYKVLGLLGEGGMGAVYLVEQEKPIRRKVALKVRHQDAWQPACVTERSLRLVRSPQPRAWLLRSPQDRRQEMP